MEDCKWGRVQPSSIVIFKVLKDWIPWCLRDLWGKEVPFRLPVIIWKGKIFPTVKTAKCSMQKAQHFLHKTEISNETIYDTCKIVWMRSLSNMNKLKRNKNLSTTQSFTKESGSFSKIHSFAPIVRLGVNIRIIWWNSNDKINIQ